MAKRTYTDVPEPRYVERALNIVDKSIPYSGTITQEIIDALKDQRSTGITYQGKTFRYSLTSGNNDIYSYVGSESGKVYFEKITINTANKTWSYARQEITAVVQGVDVKSTGIAANRVLAADGEGGSQWNIALTLPEPPQETKSIAVNDQGEIVYVDAPVFSVNGRTGDVAGLAEQDGYYTSLTAGTAEQILSTVSVNDKVPYLFRTSGGNADIGNRELDKLVGGTIAWNQMIQNGTFTSQSYWAKIGNGSISVEDNILSYACAGAVASEGVFYNDTSDGIILGHKYLVSIDARVTESSDEVFLAPYFAAGLFDNANGSNSTTLTTSFKNYNTILSAKTDSATRDFILGVRVNGTIETTPTVEMKNANAFDLTQMFGSTIADYIYSLEQSNSGDGVAFVRPFIENADKSYNAGELVSVKTSAHETVGFNQWDEEWELGSISSMNGLPLSSNSQIRSKNFNKALPNLTYCIRNRSGMSLYIFWYDINYDFISESSSGASAFKTVVSPDNAHYFKVREGNNSNPSTTYNHDICINLSHSGYRNGEYEPYVKHTYALDSDLELRGIPKLDANNKLYYDGDEYASDGTVTRRYGIVDLGTLTWNKSTVEANLHFSATLSDIKMVEASTTVGNLICNKYTADSINNIYHHTNDKTISVHYDSHLIWVYDSTYNESTTTEFKTAMSGVYLVYELETPTTETADPYTNPQIVDDFGTERYVDERDVPVPVGHDTDYLANLRDKLQRLPNIPAEEGDYIVRYANGQCSFIGYVEKGRMELDITSIGTVTSTSLISGMWYRTNIGFGSVSISDTDTLYVKMSNGAVYPCINNYTSSQLVIFGASDLSTQTVVKLWKII